jgi:hypothetical protein
MGIEAVLAVALSYNAMVVAGSSFGGVRIEMTTGIVLIYYRAGREE